MNLIITSCGEYGVDIPGHMLDVLEDRELRTIAYGGHINTIIVMPVRSVYQLVNILNVTCGWLGISPRYPGYFELDIARYD